LDLQQKFERGEITQEEYERQKSRSIGFDKHKDEIAKLKTQLERFEGQMQENERIAAERDQL
jgi:Short C-terminal domain